MSDVVQQPLFAVYPVISEPTAASYIYNEFFTPPVQTKEVISRGLKMSICALINHTGYVICYFGCEKMYLAAIKSAEFWIAKLQTKDMFAKYITGELSERKIVSTVTRSQHTIAFKLVVYERYTENIISTSILKFMHDTENSTDQDIQVIIMHQSVLLKQQLNPPPTFIKVHRKK